MSHTEVRADPLPSDIGTASDDAAKQLRQVQNKFKGSQPTYTALGGYNQGEMLDLQHIAWECPVQPEYHVSKSR
eukprot:321742-Amphidinium_carterae.1